MKTTLQNVSLLLVGLLLFSSCSEEETGGSEKPITENIEVKKDIAKEDTTPIDSIKGEEPRIIEPVPPPPPPPAPLPPDPWPEPEPEPWPDPIVPPPLPKTCPPPPLDPDPIVDIVEVMPSFPGGEIAMKKFMSENMKYPEIDKELGNQGRVFLQFVVERDGSLTKVAVKRGVSSTIDTEAMRMIQVMPNWTPGEIGGKLVRTRVILPVTFTLN